MQIVAKTTDGFLIQATKSEVIEILRSVQGESPKEINIGQKIPAIDYASTITKLKQLPDEYNYKQLMIYAEKFSNYLLDLKDSVEKATKL